MDLNLTEPAVLFPAISLMMLAYTNRFLALAALIRSLHERYQTKHEEIVAAQISKLRYRVLLIRNMQAFAVLSLLSCLVCILALFFDQQLVAKITFGLGLVLMAVSLTFSIREIWLSVDALNLQLKDMEVTDEEEDLA